MSILPGMPVYCCHSCHMPHALSFSSTHPIIHGMLYLGLYLGTIDEEENEADVVLLSLRALVIAFSFLRFEPLIADDDEVAARSGVYSWIEILTSEEFVVWVRGVDCFPPWPAAVECFDFWLLLLSLEAIIKIEYQRKFTASARSWAMRILTLVESYMKYTSLQLALRKFSICPAHV